MTEVVRDAELLRKQRLVVIWTLLAVLSLSIFDIVEDYLGGVSAEHIEFELLTTAVGLTGLLYGWFGSSKRWFQRNVQLTADLASTKADAHKWAIEVRELKKGILDSIEKQFIRWELTLAEKEIGLLLLKGYSLKEIALFRQTSEQTVRSQAASIYKRSNLDNRSQFSAFFLEDLLG